MPYFWSNFMTAAMTTDEQSVSGMKPILTSFFSGASEPAAHAPTRTASGTSDSNPAAPAPLRRSRRLFIAVSPFLKKRKPHHLADDDERRRAERVLHDPQRQRAERREHLAPRGQRAVLDGAGGRRRREPAQDHRGDELRQAREAHVDGERHAG